MRVVDEDIYNAEEKIDELLDKLGDALERKSKQEIVTLQNQLVYARDALKKLKPNG